MRLKDGQAVFFNRYVETSRLKQERAKGKAAPYPPAFPAFPDPPCSHAPNPPPTDLLFHCLPSIHQVRLKDGQAVFSNRYVETSRLKQERAKGEASFLKLGDLMGMRGLALVLIESVRRCVGQVWMEVRGV